MIQLNPRDSRPIHEQIQESIRRLIYTGVLREGDRLPSVRQQASSLAINPNTIQRAYAQLEAEGILVSYPGKGSFVAKSADAKARRRKELEVQLRQVLQELAQLGASPQELKMLVEQETGGMEP